MARVEIRGLDHVVLRVADLAASLAFYGEVLGCREERRIDALGLVQLRAGDSLIDLVPIDSPLGRAAGAGPGAPEQGGRNVDHFALRVAALDAAVLAALEAAGLDPGEPATRYGAEGNGPSVYIRDPDQNVVELKGPPDV